MAWLMLLSGTAASWGEFCTIPFDTAKVRLQIQDSSNPKYRGLLHVLQSMFRDEGLTVPWRGVSAGIQRQMAFAPIRIGLYEPVRNFYVSTTRHIAAQYSTAQRSTPQYRTRGSVLSSPAALPPLSLSPSHVPCLCPQGQQRCS